MGIYDRDYLRPEPWDRSPRTSWSVVGVLIALNVAVWLADFLSPETDPGHHWLSDHLAVHVDTLRQPWMWWQFVTYSFTHSPQLFWHILGNMLVLFFFGREIETRYGGKEFLRFYLAAAVIAAIFWAAANRIAGTDGDQGAFGASGAVTAVVALFALNFPHVTILLFFVIPMPAWLLGVLVVALDLFGALGGEQAGKVAYSMHLAGAGFALLYYWQGWNFSNWTSFRVPRWPRMGKPRLRVHRPDEPEEDLGAEVDRILAKISAEGEAGLSAKERKTLENASRRYREKRDRPK